ncbi:hypothetical protein OHB12_11810 [Nocardia sp. NBC_01730]|uniref:hypothetical protein n=1 Tax=Nocardia sp. NBC_01730 TaxID=2975998 RepID=UPI002E13218F|nr:hypothetical protein OHB12_11810 [Nocardia sp. NBC_01730]
MTADNRHPIEDQPVCGDCVPQLSRCGHCREFAIALTDTADERRLCARCVAGWLPCVSCTGVTDPRVRTDTDEAVCLRCAAVFFDICFQCSRYSAATRYVSGVEEHV